MQYGRDIYFTRVIVFLALLGHQTSNLQNKRFFPSCILYFSFLFFVQLKKTEKSAYSKLIYENWEKMI